MLRYGELRAILERLEAESIVGEPPAEAAKAVRPARSGDGAARSRVQFFALDTDTASVTEPLPIVVAVGVNYTQGDTEVPTDTQPNAVEDQLKNCRMNAMKALRHFAGNTALWRWAGHVSDALAAVDPERSHFVMTNISPWITTASWQDDTIPDSARSALWEDGLARRTIARLERALRPHAPTWIAHGIHTALFQEWPRIALENGISRWLRTGNLAHFYNYEQWTLLAAQRGATA